MRYWGAVFLAGCSFNTSLAPANDGSNERDAMPIDARPDVLLLPVCNVGVTATPGTDRGRVGGNGGDPRFPPLRCTNAADRIVGIGIRMSNQNTLFGAPSAHGLSIACATVTLDPNAGSAMFGTPYTVEVMGNGNQGWAPSTLTAPTLCPAGMVVSGLQARTGQNRNIFANVDMRCSRLDATDATTTSTQVVHVAGSSEEAQNLDTENCNSNEILVEMSNRTGSGFDSANLFCAPARCL